MDLMDFMPQLLIHVSIYVMLKVDVKRFILLIAEQFIKH